MSPSVGGVVGGASSTEIRHVSARAFNAAWNATLILASTVNEQSIRQARLQQTEATFEPITFDAAAARNFGQIVAAVATTGRSHQLRIADLLIAVIAHANGLELYTRNPDDFVGLEELIDDISV